MPFIFSLTFGRDLTLFHQKSVLVKSCKRKKFANTLCAFPVNPQSHEKRKEQKKERESSVR